MRFGYAAALFLLLLQSGQASIDGVVVADTGQPIAGAELQLVGVAPSGKMQVAMTDSDGKFSFTHLSAGSYSILVRAIRFAPQSYAQSASNGSATLISLSADQKLKDLSIRLVSGGIVTGKIQDESGKGAIGVPVRIFQVHYSPQGRVYNNETTTFSDDRGVYRAFGIAPGRYYMSIGDKVGSPARSDRGGESRKASTLDIAYQFYPGVSDLDQAIPIDVQAGAELTIDMTTKYRKNYRIHGTVIDSATGKPPASIAMNLVFNSGGATINSGVSHSYDPKTGSFEVPDLPSGSYVLQAQTRIFDAISDAAGEAKWAVFPTARRQIRIKDQDLEDIAMILTRPVTVSGRVHAGGEVLARSGRVLFWPLEGSTAWLPPSVEVAANGTFHVIGLVEGEYTVRLQDYSAGFYIKSIQFEGDDILTKPFRYSGPATGTIDIVLSRGTASITGVLTDARSRPVNGGVVTLLQEGGGRIEAFLPAKSDQNGNFSFSDLPPGDYKLFGWEKIEIGAEYDPQFISQFESQGKHIHLAESIHQAVDVRAIPAP